MKHSNEYRLHYRAGQRFDCGAEASLTLRLGTTSDASRRAPRLGRHDNVDSNEAVVDEPLWEEDCCAHIDFKGQHRQWKLYACTIKALPAGTRFAGVTLQGKDTQFWAGHFGMKFAKPCLRWIASETSQAQVPPVCSKPCFHAVFDAEGVTSSLLEAASATSAMPAEQPSGV